MRDYARFYPRFWIGSTGRKCRELGVEYTATAAYLISSPHSNMIGLYYLPITLLAHEVGVTKDCASRVLGKLEEIGFCSYDHDAEIIWVHEACRYQLGDALGTPDKQCQGAVKQYESAPDCTLLEPFFNKYKGLIPLKECRCEGLAKPSASPSEGDTQALPIQSDGNGNGDRNSDEQQTLAKSAEATGVAEVTAHYLEIYPKRSAQTKNRKVVSKIREQLKHYSAEDLCRAIDGNRKSEYHQNGGYDGLYCILQEPDRIDRFLKIAAGELNGSSSQAPPKLSARAEAFRRGAEFLMRGGFENAGNGQAEISGAIPGNAKLLPERPG